MPSDNPKALPIFLIGYRCTGKSTTGKLLAAAFNRMFIDTDLEIERTAGTTISTMVKDKGWSYFRDLETLVLQGIPLDQAPVVATGGGLILAEENQAFLQTNGTCIWLMADEATIIKRILADTTTQTLRPDLTDQGITQETREMLDIRSPIYRRLADLCIDTAAASPEETVQLIIKELHP